MHVQLENNPPSLDPQTLALVEAWLFGPVDHGPAPPRLWVLRETVYTLRRLVDASQLHQRRKCPRARAEVVRLLALLEGLHHEEEAIALAGGRAMGDYQALR